MRGLILLATVCFSACASTGKGLYYEIKHGDTLWSVARMHNTEVESILKYNHFIKDPGHIKTGLRLRLPGSASCAQKQPSDISPASALRNKPQAKEKTGFIWPVKGKIIRSFGSYGNKRSQGIVIESAEGQPVLAARSGDVIFAAGRFKSYGNTVIIDHADNYITVYAYNRKNLVRPGRKVEKGERIAETGICDELGKPGLYFEIRFKEQPKNPLFYLE